MKEIGVVRVLLAILRNLKIVTYEVQKKTKQNRKKQKVYFMLKSIECAHRKFEKVNTHKK